jgi:hypothetical protein
MPTNWDISPEDLITAANPITGIKLGFPLSGTYAGFWCQKDTSGNITPCCPSGIAIPAAPVVVLGDGATVIFTPGTFTPTTSSKVTMGGARIVVGFDVTTNPGSFTFAVAPVDGIELIFDQW